MALKISYLIAALAAVLLLGAGFAVGLSTDGNREIIPLSSENREETAPEETVEELPAPETVAIPEEDVPGADIDGLDRYPGSVRIEYLREHQGEMIWTETEYLTDASMSEAREHYRDLFRRSDWSVNDIGFAQDSWVFFVVKGEREVFVELKPRGSGVEVDLEQTEPAPAERPEPQQSQPEQVAPAPVQPAPVQPAPAQSAPVYDDDLYEDDDGYEDDDDDYGEYDD